MCVQGKIKVAKEAYEKFLVRDNLPPALKAVALRQLGEYGDCPLHLSPHGSELPRDLCTRCAVVCVTEVEWWVGERLL